MLMGGYAANTLASILMFGSNNQPSDDVIRLAGAELVTAAASLSPVSVSESQVLVKPMSDIITKYLMKVVFDKRFTIY